MAQKRKHYYAVARGTIPGIYTEWASACAYSAGVSGSVQQAFKTLDDAKDWMHKQGCTDYFVDKAIPSNCTTTRTRHYGVGKGRRSGVYSSYLHGAEVEVRGYSNACHQAFSNEKDAVKHVQHHEEALLARQHIEDLMRMNLD